MTLRRLAVRGPEAVAGVGKTLTGEGTKMVSLKYRQQPGHRLIRRGCEQAAPRIDSSNAPLAANDDAWPKPGRSNRSNRGSVLEMMWYIAGRFPFHTATLVSVPAVAIVLTLIGGLHLYRSLWTSLSMADPIGATLSVLLALVVATYSLLATLAVSHMRGEIQREKRDIAAYEALRNMSINQDDINSNVRELRRTADRLLELQHTITNRERPSAMARTNDETPWSNFAPNSELASIGGQMRLDAKIEMLSNDKRRCVVDQTRIARTTLPRFMPPTALRIATYILFVGSPNDQDPSNVPAAVASHLAVFRTVKSLAHRRGVEPMLNRIRFYLIAGSPAVTRITGEYLLNGSSVPFVNTYLDVGLMYGFKSGIVDDRVLTSLHPEDVTNARHLAEVLTANQIVYTLDELEAKYGQFVDSVEVNPLDLSTTLGPFKSFLRSSPSMIGRR
jgi:hypothetical protein